MKITGHVTALYYATLEPEERFDTEVAYGRDGKRTVVIDDVRWDGSNYVGTGVVRRKDGTLGTARATWIYLTPGEVPLAVRERLGKARALGLAAAAYDASADSAGTTLEARHG